MAVPDLLVQWRNSDWPEGKFSGRGLKLYVDSDFEKAVDRILATIKTDILEHFS